MAADSDKIDFEGRKDDKVFESKLPVDTATHEAYYCDPLTLDNLGTINKGKHSVTIELGIRIESGVLIGTDYSKEPGAIYAYSSFLPDHVLADEI